jgi:glycosyltransferase involved in cell wall biosynthesis
LIRLAVVSTHPIQYNAPAFRSIASQRDITARVFYEWEGPVELDREFGQPVEWDIPLLDGYDYAFVRNRSTKPGSDHFWGIDNPTLVREVLEWQPDVLLLYGWSFKSHVDVLRRIHGKVPIIFRGDSTLVDEMSPSRRFARRTLLRYLFGKVDVALYAGRRNRDYFQWAGVKPEKCAWGPHAVDNQRFSQTPSSMVAATHLRSQLEIGRGDMVYLFAGKLSPRKDPGVLLEAFLRGNNSFQAGSHLVFAGSGSLEKQLRKEAEGVRNVHFLGFQNQSQMPVVYQLADVLVLPSRQGETWGLAVNEAMAAGRPAICSTSVGCVPDLIDEGVTGYTFAAGSRDELQRCLTSMGNRDKAQAMGKAANKLIAQWSIEAYAAAVVGVARRLSQ